MIPRARRAVQDVGPGRGRTTSPEKWMATPEPRGAVPPSDSIGEPLAEQWNIHRLLPLRRHPKPSARPGVVPPWRVGRERGWRQPWLRGIGLSERVPPVAKRPLLPLRRANTDRGLH